MSKRLEYKANGADAAAPVQGTETSAPVPAGEQQDPLTVPVRQSAARERNSPEGGSFSQRNETAVDNKETGLLEKTEGANTEQPRYSIREDRDGNKFVQVDNDILKGVPAEEQLNVVRDAIRDMFPEGFERDGNHIDNTREGRGEFVRSKYSRALGKAEPGIHADKMRMAGNLDEIIQTSTNVENEKANHKNAESFNRGKVNVRVGANDYSVDVLTAIKNDGREVQYDLVNIQPTKNKCPGMQTHPRHLGISGELQHSLLKRAAEVYRKPH